MGVAAVAVRDDAKIFAAGYWDGRVRLFEYGARSSGRTLASFGYHEHAATARRVCAQSFAGTRMGGARGLVGVGEQGRDGRDVGGVSAEGGWGEMGRGRRRRRVIGRGSERVKVPYKSRHVVTTAGCADSVAKT